MSLTLQDCSEMIEYSWSFEADSSTAFVMYSQGSPRTPTKKSWMARMSTRSGRSGPPPSPAMSSAGGFAM